MSRAFVLPMAQRIAAPVLVVAVGIAGALWLDGRRRTDDAQTRALLAALTARIEAVESHSGAPRLPADFRRDLHAMRGMPPSGNGLTRAPGRGLLGETESSLSSEPGARPVDPNEVAQELDALHKRDKADPAGGAAVAGRLEAFAAEPALVESKLIPSELQTDCRATRCRIAARFPRAGDAEDWATMLTTLSASQLSYARIVQIPRGDGSAEVRIYGARR